HTELHLVASLLCARNVAAVRRGPERPPPRDPEVGRRDRGCSTTTAWQAGDLRTSMGVVMYRHKAGPRVLNRIAPGVEPATFSRFRVTPLAATLGGLVTGLDLSEPLDDDTFAQLDH